MSNKKIVLSNVVCSCCQNGLQACNGWDGDDECYGYQGDLSIRFERTEKFFILEIDAPHEYRNEWKLSINNKKDLTNLKQIHDMIGYLLSKR